MNNIYLFRLTRRRTGAQSTAHQQLLESMEDCELPLAYSGPALLRTQPSRKFAGHVVHVQVLFHVAGHPE